MCYNGIACCVFLKDAACTAPRLSLQCISQNLKHLHLHFAQPWWSSHACTSDFNRIHAIAGLKSWNMTGGWTICVWKFGKCHTCYPQLPFYQPENRMLHFAPWIWQLYARNGIILIRPALWFSPAFVKYCNLFITILYCNLKLLRIHHNHWRNRFYREWVFATP